jgi:hypothetical protein
MPGGLVNEKTLELNITHERMVAGQIGAFGFTQQQEILTGGDAFFPCARPQIIQFKAAKSGVDNSVARFYINNNTNRNQHRALHSIDVGGFCDAVYAFPLIVTHSFLTSSFGRFSNFTHMVHARQITGNLNWHNTTHSVEVFQNGRFVVRSSETVEGQCFSARKFFEILVNEAKGEEKQVDEERDFPNYVKKLTAKLDDTVRKAGIVGDSDHTLLILGKNHSEQYGYLQLYLRIKGLKEEEKEKVAFT